MKSDVIQSKDWPGLDGAIAAGDVPSFFYKKDAIAAGAKFGWRCAVRVVRRFEIIWLCGELEFQPEEILGIMTFDVLRVSLLRWEADDFGVVKCPHIKFRKLRRKN